MATVRQCAEEGRGLEAARAALETEGGHADPADDEPVEKEERERFDD